MRAAWQKLDNVFSVRQDGKIVEGKKSSEPECVIVGHPRLPLDLLNQQPVDMLAVERGYATQLPRS
jgi:hypothetical protein